MVDRTSGDDDAGAAGGRSRPQRTDASKPGAKPLRGASSKSAARPAAARAAAKAKGAAGDVAAPARGRARGLAPASAFLRGAVGDAAAKRGIAETRLLTQWAAIVGPDLAAATQPLRLRRRAGLALGGVLAVAVDGARATEIEHKLPQLIERVNAHYGYRAVSEIALTQAVDGLRPAAPKAARQGSRRAPTEEERRRIAAVTDPIGDGALRAALARLGENVMARAAEKRAKADKGGGAPADGDQARRRASKSSTDRPKGA